MAKTRTRYQRAVKQASAAGECALSDGGERANGGGVMKAKRDIQEAKEKKAASKKQQS